MKNVIRWLVPNGLAEYHRQIIQLKQEKLDEEEIEKKNIIKAYFLSLNRNEQDPEILEIIKYFENNPFSIFPYFFIKKYNPEEIKVFTDKSCNMKYIMHDNKRLYFPKGWNSNSIRNNYNNLCMEQDKDSPHRYETSNYVVKDEDIIADIGAAEGIWALTYVEKAKKIYLFECEPGWIKALKKTFEPWKNKVVIVNKYVSNKNKGTAITLDNFFKESKINFIKVDIEGFECQMLEGATRILTEKNDLKILLCTYHKKDDAIYLKEYLERKEFITEYSKGFMLFIYDKELDIPYVRRGLIRATKI
jgi:hypothetical protein